MKPIFTSNEWTLDSIKQTWQVIDDIARNKFELDYYEPQIEIVSSEQMIYRTAHIGLPFMYSHWSFGKHFIKHYKDYKQGRSGLALEMIINSNPSIAYLNENNSMVMQATTLAHAVCGHSSFFKNNYLFKQWTDADYILEYLKYAMEYIKACEEKYGFKEVETLLDACHSLRYFSLDKYPKKLDLGQELRTEKWNKYFEETFNDVWRTVPKSPQEEINGEKTEHISEENLLRFIEKNSRTLEDWQRKICRISRKLSQYFYPQMQDSLMNEGWASFIHHLLMTDLFDQGYITEAHYLEFIDQHCRVVNQQGWETKKDIIPINVYALGFAMFNDIKRMCQNPTKEDIEWCPDICNTDWMQTCKDIVANYRDESFIQQFLSPKIIRDFKLFIFNKAKKSNYVEVTGIHKDEDITEIRQTLANAFDIHYKLPNITVVGVDKKDDSLQIHHTVTDRLLNLEETKKTIRYIHQLWGHPVYVTYVDKNGEQIDEV